MVNAGNRHLMNVDDKISRLAANNLAAPLSDDVEMKYTGGL